MSRRTVGWAAAAAAAVLVVGGVVVLEHRDPDGREVGQSVDFGTPVTLGSWPSDGSAPDGYPGVESYPDGTAGKYFPSQVLSVHDGMLDWWCHDGMAASVVPFGYDGSTYGSFSVRMRTDQFAGYHIAFLLWPASNRWTNEIDYPENETSADRPYPAVLQSTSPVSFDPPDHVLAPATWQDWHTYRIEWTPDAVAFFQDDERVAEVTTRVPHEPMRLTLQVEWSNQLADGERPDASDSGHVYVRSASYSTMR